MDGGNEPGKGSQQLSAFAAGITCVDDNVLVTDTRRPGGTLLPFLGSGFLYTVNQTRKRSLKYGYWSTKDNSNSRVQAIPAGCVRAPCGSLSKRFSKWPWSSSGKGCPLGPSNPLMLQPVLGFPSCSPALTSPGDVKTFATGVKWPLGIAAVNGGRRVLVTLDEGIVSFLPNGTSQRDWSSRGDMGFLCEGGGRILAASGGDGNVVSFDPACLGSWDGFLPCAWDM